MPPCWLTSRRRLDKRKFREKRRNTVPDQSHHRLTEEFGGNEWLVDELYQQFLKDKNSVDKKWWDIFASLNSDQAAAPPAAEAPVAADPTSRRPPRLPPAGAPRAATQARVVDVSGTTPGASSESSTASSAQPPPPRASRPTRPRPPSPSRSRHSCPRPQLPGAMGEEKRTPLRGPAKAIATNMDASLTFPTATTVRAVPAKAADRQPRGHQQPPRARPRRQGLLHAPDRLRRDPRPEALPLAERLLRRGRRQADGRPARPT